MKDAGKIKFLDDFEGSMIGNHHFQGNNLFIELKKEKPTEGHNKKKFDYNLHFHFGLCALSNDMDNVNIFIDSNNKNDLPHNLPRLWISDSFDREYQLVTDIVGKTDFHGKYFFEIKLEAKKDLYIANFPPLRYTRLKKEIQDLSLKSNAKEVIIGKSVENRDIKAYEYGNINEKPTILIVSGFHPPERDTVAIEAIMEKFFSDKQWKEEIFRNYSFSLIPVLNPDGFANMMQGSNMNNINFHWRFFGNSIDQCPESHFIWEYCKTIKPIVFFDFHAFTFQDNNAMPYLIPKGYYVGKKARMVQNDLNISLKELCSDRYSRAEKIFSPNLLSTRLRNDFGTITSPKFHLHMKDGINESKEMAINCFEIILDVLHKYKIESSDEILKKPYGKIKSNINDEVRIKMLNFWNFRIKSILKKIVGN